MGAELDSQQVESLGRSALTAQLVGDGLEVAQPERDCGIDLLAYTIEPWRVAPIQMKAATNAVFSVHEKYEHIPGLIMVYVWHARDPSQVEFYAMGWREAKAIADDLEWTKRHSWTKGGGYGTTRPSKRVRAKVEPHRMGPGGWRVLLAQGRGRVR